MFFHWSNFSNFLTDDQAILAAKVANEVISKSGQVVFGNVTTDNGCHDFDSIQDKNHSHVAMLIGVETMGELKPLKNPIKMDGPTNDDVLRALQDQNNQLKRQIVTLGKS